VLEPEEDVACVPVRRVGLLIARGNAQLRANEATLQLAFGEPEAAVLGPPLHRPREPAGGHECRAQRPPHRGARPRKEHRQLHERGAVRREHPGQLEQVPEHEPAARQVLQHEVADDDICAGVAETVEARSRDKPELDVLGENLPLRDGQHLAGDVDRDHPVEPLSEVTRHSPAAAADLDADAPARIGFQPREEALELLRGGLGRTDVTAQQVGGGRGSVPGRSHPGLAQEAKRSAATCAHYGFRSMLEALVRPRGPYSLALSARLASDATRTFRDGVLRTTLETESGLERALAAQAADSTVTIRAESEEGLDRLRFVLGLDDDHTPFLRRFDRDPLLGESVRWLRGLRPIRVPTVAHALLRALCGQLIESGRARALERRIVRAATPSLDGLHASPTAEALGGFSTAELRGHGLHARRAATLVRLCRALDLERLRALPTEPVAQRLEREPGLGPWSAGVVCLEGLGRWERGLVGDLGLVKLCSALRGRRVEAWETAELLEPYGEWAGLASVYLLTGWSRGLVPVPRVAAA
jgi:DNA-3-methyladenine glycosylase II